MKILGSYKKMMNEFINEDDEKVYKTDSGKWAGNYDGDIEYFDDKEKAQHWSEKGDMEFGDDADDDGKDDKDDAGKLSGKSDFSRDGDEPEAEPQSEPKADKQEPDYAGSIEDDEEAGQLANNLAQGFDADSAHQELTDMGHGDLADDLKFADSDEEKARIIAKATGNEFYEETININGKQYKPIRESKKHILKENNERIFGEK